MQPVVNSILCVYPFLRGGKNYKYILLRVTRVHARGSRQQGCLPYQLMDEAMEKLPGPRTMCYMSSLPLEQHDSHSLLE